MIGNCFKATQKKDNTRAPRAMEGESNISRLHNIFSASQYNMRNITCLFLYYEHSSSSHVSFKDFSLSGLSPMTNTSYRWRSARYPASSSSSSSLARRWRRVGLMGAPCSGNPLPRLALAWRKTLLWLWRRHQWAARRKC